ncbi:MAG: hypothetical protein IPL26_12580 [Leptospiraceae bacterium]|nr:hypothetical protein [Leptospiraceae bacterium]
MKFKVKLRILENANELITITKSIASSSTVVYPCLSNEQAGINYHSLSDI